MSETSLSVVCPTLGRPDEVRSLLANLAAQTRLPDELILVDGAEPSDRRTEDVVREVAPSLPFPVRHERWQRGTAIQRNRGIDLASGAFVGLIDDDIRLEPDFYRVVLDAFTQPENHDVGGITGYITDQHLDPQKSRRWRWYRRLRLFGTYEPGRFDWATGHPINRYLQPPHETLRELDVMGAGCATWRRAVFDQGIRFAPFFADFGVLEDAHLALTAGRHEWRLLEAGRAHCRHLRSQTARVDNRRLCYKTAVNYRYVFLDIVRPRRIAQELGFWKVQLVDFLRLLAHAVKSPSKRAWGGVWGKVEGLMAAAFLPVPRDTPLATRARGTS
ncbi:MAG: glycosyltransferase [Acidobacteriota bacterium]